MTCRICGQLFAPTVAVAAEGDDVLRQACPECREKLAATVDQDAHADRTTVLRPRSALSESPRVAASLFGGKQVWTGPDSTGPRDVLAPEPGSSGPAAPQAQRTLQPPAVGKLFGNYEILAEVSRGSFGVVYRARQQGLDRIVALKVLLAGSHASPEAVARFQREARAVAKLKHANIVPIYDIGTQDGHHYFAMEFVEGRSLSAQIQKQAVTIPDALAIAEALADAIESAHQQGVIHRDIKPSNILVDPRGLPHLTDFGLAKQVDLDTQYTQSGTTLGTPAYMPPEQARGEVQNVDARSDVYALGAVLYEMLAGKPPFAGRSLLEVVIAVINEPVRPPRQVNPRIHRDVQTIVMKCLEKDARNRYQSAAELRDDIRRFRSGEAIRARPVGLVRSAGRFLKKNSFFFGAAATVLLTVVLAAYWLAAQRNEFEQRELSKRREDEELQKQRELAEKARQQPVFKEFWWFPERQDLQTPEEERPLFHAGFVPAAPARLAPDLVNGQPQLVNGANMLCSPDRKLIIGDLMASIQFKLDETAAAAGVRIGIHSWDSAIPYLLQIRSGTLALIGPADLAAEGNLPGRPASLRIKAEKRGPALLPGTYELKIVREGLLLSFELIPPVPAERAALQVWDLGLSHWKFKNTQLTIREPPKGFETLGALVHCKVSPERPEKMYVALTYFSDGEYNRADFYFKEIVESPESQQDEKGRLRAAMACLYRGLIQDVSFPGDKRDNVRYSEALDLLSKCQPSPERGQLQVQVALRRLVRLYRENRWPALDLELQRIAQAESELGVRASGLGEPYAWELLPLAVGLAANPDSQARDRAFNLLLHLGLPPGNAELDRTAGQLALHLSQQEDRLRELYQLHRSYPASSLLPAFVDAAQRAFASAQPARALELLDHARRSFRGAAEDAALEKAVAALFAEALRRQQVRFGGEVLAIFPRPALLAQVTPALPALAQAASGEEASAVVALLKLAARVAEPSPQSHPPLADPLMAELLKAKQPERALAFYGLARPEMRGEAPRLFLRAVEALDALSDDRAREVVLGEVRKNLRTALERDIAEDRQARLEAGDLHLAAGNATAAVEEYQELYSERGLDQVLAARVALRVGALLTILQTAPTPEIWNNLINSQETPEEVRLAGQFLLNMVAVEDLETRLTQAGGALIFSEAEWLLIRALRLRADGKVPASEEAMKQAAQKSEAARAWPWALARAINRAGRAGPEAPKEPAPSPSQ